MLVTTDAKSREDLFNEIDELHRRLEETEDVLAAIRSGAVDALVVSIPEGEQVFTLQGAEHPYRVLLETMNEGAATLAADGMIVYCNNRLAKMVGVPLEKLIGAQLISCVSPRDRYLFLDRLQSQMHESVEITIITGSGEHLPVLFSSVAVELSGTKLVSAVLTDIGVRKQSEKTILRLNRLYAVLSATNHAIIHASDPDTLFREFCRIAVERGNFRLAWVGIVDQETGLIRVAAASGETHYLDGIRVSINLEPEGMGPVGTSIREGTAKICNDFHNSETTGPWQQRARTYDLFAAASIPIRQGQKVIGALGFYASEKNFFDSQQVELLQQIGSEVSFALDNLNQSQVRREAEQALRKETVGRLKAVEELSQKDQLLIHQSRQAALGEMIGNIAHQWRQPLNTLGLLVQQAPIFYELGEVDKEFLETNARKSMEVIQHMSQTIDDFRNFFKPDKEKVMFNVHETITRTLSLMDGSIQTQHICVEVDAKGDPLIHGYPNEFSQVLLNILMNARDALTERNITKPKVIITIDTEGDRGVITVADNAGGISEKIMDKIFDPYFTTKGPQAGTGVGLFMSKSIIEKNMGGELSVRNSEQGAEFKIVI